MSRPREAATLLQTVADLRTRTFPEMPHLKHAAVRCCQFLLFEVRKMVPPAGIEPATP